MPNGRDDEQQRVVIEHVRPEIDCGRFPIKRVVGETVTIEADIFADGHDQIACQVLHWQDGCEAKQTSSMQPLGNDRWRGEFSVSILGRHKYTVEAWIDHFGTWRSDLLKRIAANQDIHVEMLIGVNWVEEAITRANATDAELLRQWMLRWRKASDTDLQQAVALEKDFLPIVQRYPEAHLVTRYAKILSVVVDREKARFSSWYEIFPRSCASDPSRHGTLRDCEARLPYIASMGFDVVYLPPIHPIGHTFRKGKNNATAAQPDDVGSPWAIGAAEGGHTALEQRLGTLEDFKQFVASAKAQGLEVALDLAFQCSPDHPYVKQHKNWFRIQPDGTIRYAENSPKKYQDIYPFDFDSVDWRSLWDELGAVVLFWIDQGVRIFRVDNPHTKPFPFWEWLIGDIKKRYPDTIFLGEAFTKPRVMYRLAKLGFCQSYTYFAWRNTKQELTDFFRELTQTEVSEYFRPNLWPNTPDILPEFLQAGGRPAFMIRFILAATLGSSYGIYGPAFELCENTPCQPGSEEYLNSEKYELKYRDLDSPASLRELISRVNRIRNEHPALQANRNLRFHEIDNPSLLCYSKVTDDLSDVIIVIVNLDSSHRQIGWTGLDLGPIGLENNQAFQVHDLLGEGRYLWNGPRNYVELTPGSLPAHILHVRRWVRSEHDFDYYR